MVVDLYADWCVACKEFEHKTFPQPEVQAQLALEEAEKVRQIAANLSRANPEYVHPFMVAHPDATVSGMIVVTTEAMLSRSRVRSMCPQ